MSKGISNVQFENAFKNIEDEDLNANFVGVFPSNHMNKFINHAAMISDKEGKQGCRNNIQYCKIIINKYILI